jgi:L-histidine N-alpha-methyltransferase
VQVHLSPDAITAALCQDARHGLTSQPKVLPAKWLYDDVGCALFDRITRLPEYYPTRRESQILNRYAAEIAVKSGADTLVELGSGTSDKTRTILDAMSSLGRLRRFAPLDVAENTLRGAAEQIVKRYPDIVVDGVVGDFEQHLVHIPDGGKRLIAFLGSTIGNLDSSGRATLLRSLASVMKSGDYFLVGTDLIKDRHRLIAAYDDSQGVTAAFNKNVLRVLNRQLGGHFAVDRFDHVAYYDEDKHRIEMRLRSQLTQLVPVDKLGVEIAFEAGEDLLTEISTKFTKEQMQLELEEAGLTLESWYTDPAGDFAIALAGYD